MGPTFLVNSSPGVWLLTSIFAVDVFPCPPFVEVIVTELVLSPVATPVTLIENEQVAPASTVPPVKFTEDEPGTAVIVPPSVPEVQVGPTRPFGEATCNCELRSSAAVKPTPVKDVEVLGLRMEKIRLVVSPVRMGLFPNDFEIMGGATTVIFASP